MNEHTIRLMSRAPFYEQKELRSSGEASQMRFANGAG